MNMARGIILILHSGFSRVNLERCLEALPEELRRLDREKIEVKYSVNLELGELYGANFGQLALEHRRQFTNEILPILEAKSDYVIAYFGLSPIPLAVDFGQLFHNYREFMVFQKHHKTKGWYQRDDFLDLGKTIEISGIPDPSQRGITSALIRVSSSHNVNPEETLAVVPNAAEVDIGFKTPDEDAIASPELMNDMAEKVKAAFDSLSNNKSGIKQIHLFAAIPCGLAFLIGTKISPNVHPFVQTYQYSRTETPSYKKALLIKSRIEPERKINEDDERVAMELRRLADTELKGDIRSFCIENEKSSNQRNWYVGVAPSIKVNALDNQFWNDLPSISQTSLRSDGFCLERDTIQDGFFWRKGLWHVDDNFFISLKNRLGKDLQLKQAIRLFLFHEALHYKRHNLNDSTANNIGSFPKVLEMADYQSDVYALLNEYGYSSMHGSVADDQEFFLDTIITATETMWSFDDMGRELTEIQIRRLNRYMIWYWQYALIEREGNNLDAIIQILSAKPIIELNGLPIKEENNRIFFKLDYQPDQLLELGVFHENKIKREGAATNLQIRNLVDGAKEMNGEKILSVLRGFL